jgi:hypothetical protein
VSGDVALGIALAMNILAVVLNVWSYRLRGRLITQQREQLIEFGKCVAMVAFLSRPESGAPSCIREQCLSLVPKGVRLHIEEVHSRVH